MSSLATPGQQSSRSGNAPSERRSQALTAGALVAIVAVGAVLRLVNLDSSPLWWDEGNNAFFAHCSLGDLLHWSVATSDTDPPVHRLLLGLWLALVGDSAFTLRALSAVFGIGTILLGYSWSRWLGGRPAGLVTAALLAFSPSLVYYSREAKGYPVVVFFGLLAMYLWFRFLRNGRRPLWMWAIYVVCSSLALGTHYYAVFLFVPQFLYALGDSLRRRDGHRSARPLRGWAIAHALIALILSPWAVMTLGSALSGARALDVERPAYDLWQFMETVIRELMTGPNGLTWAAALSGFALGLPALYGLWRDSGRRGWPLAVLIVTAMALPFLVQLWIPFFSPRFLLYLAPTLCILAGAGIARLKFVGSVPIVATAVAWVFVFPSVYLPHLGPDEDLRPVAATISRLERPGDITIVGYIWQKGILRMYAPGERDYALNWFSARNVDQEVPSVIDGHSRVWLLTYRVPLQHETNPGGLWLERHAARALLEEHGANGLALYLPPCDVTSSAGRDVQFEGGIHLVTGDLQPSVGTNEVLGLPLAWRLDQQVSVPYKVFIHVADATGKPILQTDGPPANWLEPFDRMSQGEIVSDCRAILVPEGTPPGSYVVYVGLYNPADGSRLRVVSPPGATDAYVWGNIQIR